MITRWYVHVQSLPVLFLLLKQCLQLPPTHCVPIGAQTRHLVSALVALLTFLI